MDNEDFVLGGYVSKRLFRVGVGIFILWWFGELGRVNIFGGRFGIGIVSILI